VFGGTLQQENVHRFLIMTSLLHHNIISMKNKIPNIFFLIDIFIKVIFVFNKLTIKGGGGSDILLNSGKEVISF
jgi:hypothetical protein